MNKVLFPTVLCISGVIIVLLLLGGCKIALQEFAPSRPPDVPAGDLLIDIQAFPNGWIVAPCDPITDRTCSGDMHAIRGFGRDGIPGHVIQDAHRLEDSNAARAMFQRALDADFKKSPPPQVPSADFVPSQEISYRSPIADEYHLGCGVDIVPACRAIFRYGNYFIEFFFNVAQGYVDGVAITGNGLKVKEIEPILRAMDEKAAEVLGIALATRTP